jgi:hypothetical protein
MLKHYPVTNPTLGLNTKYRAKFDRNNEALFNDDFDTVLYLSLPFNQCSHLRNPGLLQVVDRKCLLQFMGALWIRILKGNK